MALAQIKRILLVEDNENDVELTLNALKECHLSNDVEVARDGAEALDYIYRRGAYAARKDCLPCVVLLDIKMPKVDGHEVLRQIKSDPVFRHIPVVMLTSSKEDSDLMRSYNQGANAFVIKPVDCQQFHDALKTLGVFWAIVNELPPIKTT